MKWFRRGAWALLALLLAAAATLGLYAQRALPQVRGELTLPGLTAPVRIERDAHGIPTVRAESLADAAYGLGVAHAQDRLWQMETHRRIGAGRLAEVLGPGALETDKFLRALGVRRAAAAQWAQLGEESRALLQAYAAGVNAVIAQLKARPPEYLVLGFHPEPWDPVDSLAWAIMMSWDLGGNWGTELLRLRLALELEREQIDVLLPPYPGEAPLPATDYPALYRSLGLGTGAQRRVSQAWHRLVEVAPPSGVEGVGSNNWVVAGSHTTTGAPLLANDPHLKLSTPALWYFARLQAPGLDVAGATLPGLPLVVLGQNAQVAWGFTNTGPDVQDLYLEEVDPADPTRYRTPEGWAAFETVADVIRVKGQPDIAVTWRRTRHGPVISDAGTGADVLGGGAEGAATRYVLAMRWTGLDTDTDPVAVGLGFMQAASVDDFVAASRRWVAPMQSMVVADRAGRIGMVAPGRVPLRKPENDLFGLAPAPGWDARYDWAGWVPVDETPREFDPPRGFIATANQRITAPGYPHFISSDWALPYRQQRIEAVLGAKDRHSLDDLAVLMADDLSLAAQPLLPWLARAQSPHPLAAAAQAALEGFDGRMAADSPAPLIYWAWRRHLAQLILADEVGEAVWQRSLMTRTFQDTLEAVLADPDSPWCDDRGTPERENCAQMNDRALTAALDELQQRLGDVPARWRWGQAHQARGEHRPFSRVKPLARLFEQRVPTPGDTFTVNVGRVGLRPDATTGELYLNEHGPSLRALYDLADRSRSQVMHSTGQSGLVFSPRYGDWVAPWAAVRFVPLWPEGAPRDVLTLRPGP